MKNKNVRLKEIAFELGLSINTVSRALRDCSEIVVIFLRKQKK